MSKYQYKVGDYVEYIGNVKGFEDVQGKVNAIDTLGGCFITFDGGNYYMLANEIQLADLPVDPKLQEALADAWAEGWDAGYGDKEAKDFQVSPNPYRSNK